MKDVDQVLVETVKKLLLVAGLIGILFFSFRFLEDAIMEFQTAQQKNNLPFTSVFSTGEKVVSILKITVSFITVFATAVLMLMALSAIVTIVTASIRHVISHKTRSMQCEKPEDAVRWLSQQKPRDVFTLSSSDEWTKQYTLKQPHMDWTLTIKNRELLIEMKKENELYIQANFNLLSDSFTKKSIRKELAENKKALKQVNRILNRIVRTNWKEPFGFSIMTATEPVTITPLKELELTIQSVIQEKTMQQEFQSLVYQMNTLQAYESYVDIETRHLLEYSLTNDLNRLLLLYTELNETQKHAMKTAIRHRLELMNEKILYVRTKMEEKKEHEIQSVLHLFDQRYQL